MKTKALIISILLFFTLNASAQFKEYAFGLKAGPSWTWMSSPDETTTNRQTLISYNWGGFVERRHSEHLAFVTGLSVEQYRADYTYDDYRSIQNMPSYLVQVNRRYKGTYISVPVIAKINFFDIAFASLYVQGGINLSYRLNAWAQDQYLIGVYPYEDTDYRNVNSEFKTFNTSANICIGSEFDLPQSLKVFAQFVFSHSLSDLTSRNYSKNGGPNLRPSYFAFEVGILL